MVWRPTGLDVSVEGDKVSVKGKAVSQEAKEKVILAVGNVKGVATVEDDVEGADPVFHTVEKGDTLSAIAREDARQGQPLPEIFEANKPMLTPSGQDLPRTGSAHPAG